MNRNDREPYTPVHTGERMPVRKFKSRRRMTGPILAVILLSVVIVLAVIFLVWAVRNGLNLNRRDSSGTTLPEETTAPPETQPEETTAPIETEPPETVPPETTLPAWMVQYEEKELETRVFRIGDLVLVDSGHEYIFPLQPASQNIIPLYGHKSKTYALRDVNVSLRTDVIAALDGLMDAFNAQTGLSNVVVYNAFRDYQTQETIYNNYVARNGQEAADRYSARPGHSDYHTGASFELRYIAEDGNHTLAENNTYAWILEHAAEYGIICRFPADKISFTGNDFEPYHFRYVGKVHAMLMQEKNFCLEEYLAYLASYPFDGEHLKTTIGSTVYEIYTVMLPDDAGETVSVPLPKDTPYTLSGDNQGRLIVTMEAEIG